MVTSSVEITVDGKLGTSITLKTPGLHAVHVIAGVDLGDNDKVEVALTLGPSVTPVRTGIANGGSSPVDWIVPIDTSQVTVLFHLPTQAGIQIKLYAHVEGSP